MPRGRVAYSWQRVTFALLLLATYALPLFFPPGPAPLGVPTRGDAWFLERILPGVPPWWFAIRLVALVGGVVLLLPLRIAFPHVRRDPGTARSVDGAGRLRLAAVVVAVSQALVSPWAGAFGSAA